MYSVEVAESMPTAVLVANPTAQSGKAAEWIAQARRLYEKHAWPIIDVTRRSIEETAAAIMVLYQERYGAMP